MIKQKRANNVFSIQDHLYKVKKANKVINCFNVIIISYFK